MPLGRFNSPEVLGATADYIDTPASHSHSISNKRCASSIYADVEATHTQVTTLAPYILLFVALLIALAFEFVNGLRANAIQTRGSPFCCPIER